MKLKMTENNGIIALVVTGTRQEIIIVEENGCLTIEMVNVTPEQAQEEQRMQEEVTADMPVIEEESTVEECTIEEDTPPKGNNLFEKLAALRKSLATIEKVPPYLIFHDKTLHEMADKMPTSIQDMSLIPGVGQAKLEKYGTVFLDAIGKGGAA